MILLTSGKDKHYYICVILELFYGRVVAYEVSSKHSTYLIISAFSLLLQREESMTVDVPQRSRCPVYVEELPNIIARK